MKHFHPLRLIVLLLMFAVGQINLFAGDVSSASVVGESELSFVFNGSEESSPIKNLPWNNPDFKDYDLDINGYGFTFYNCVKTNTSTNLLVRGDGNYHGHFSFTMSDVVTAVRITKSSSRTSGTVTMTISKQGSDDVVLTKKVSGNGDFTFEVPDGQRLPNATVTISSDFQLALSKLTVSRTGAGIDKSDIWLRFKNLGGKTYATGSEVETIRLGQILELESNDKEGFNPVSTPDNEYVVVYSVYDKANPNGNDNVSFEAVCGSDGNWKNGSDKYPSGYTNAGASIGRVGYVYRRGIVMTKYTLSSGDATSDFADGTTAVVEVAIYHLVDDATAVSKKKAELVKIVKKEFTIVAGTRRPAWNNTSKDITFNPTTPMAIGYTDQYVEGMRVLDLNDKVTATLADKANYVVGKFSSSERYDQQSLLNSVGVSPVEGVKSSSSSEVGLRCFSVVQFTPDGIASENVGEVCYYFIKREQLHLKAVEEGTDNTSVVLDKTNGKTVATIALSATYGDDNTKVEDLRVLGLSMSNVSVGDSYVKVSNSEVVYKDNDYSVAYFTIELVSDGTTNVSFRTAKTAFPDTGKTNYTEGAAYVSVTSLNSGSVTPPMVTPQTRNFANTFKANVKGYADTKTYWILLDNSTGIGEVSTLAEASSSITGIDIKKSVLDASQRPENIHNYGLIEGAKSMDVEIPANPSGNYELYAVSEDNTNNGLGFSVIVSRAYTYMAEEKPILSPGYEGRDNYYVYYGNMDAEGNDDGINVAVSTMQNGRVVYYSVSEPLEFSTNNGVVTTNGKICDIHQGITVDKSCVVYALAYNPELDIYSDVAVYRYIKNFNDIREQPYFVIDDRSYYNNDVYDGETDGKKLLIYASYYDANGEVHTIGGEQTESDAYHIYYTTDGTKPTEKSNEYKGPIDISNLGSDLASKIIAGVIFGDGTTYADLTLSELSTLNIFSNKIAYWQTTNDNCPDGVLKEHKATISKNGTDYVDVQFGGMDTDAVWKHYASHEYATGNPIDNIGTYTIAPADDSHEGTADVRDEKGNLWNHSKANNSNYANFQTHMATFALPAKGAYVKLEPKQSGKLIVWCCQDGALYYSNAIENEIFASTNFNDAFLRKRPAYFVDEAGISYSPSSIESAGLLSSNWATDWQTSHWAKKGESQHGVEQTLYTQTQTSNIYNMFNELILEKKATANVTPIADLVVKLNTEDNKIVAGFNVADNGLEEGNDSYIADTNIDGTGICIPSASYMKYTFDVKAGKTYYFFGWMTKIGIRGLGFVPSDAATEDVDIYSGKPTSGTAVDANGNSNDNDFTSCVGKTFVSATVKRTFKSNTWTTLVLPFSVSASQVAKVFGEGTQVLHYRTIADRTIYFFKHYHQMLVAGTPVLIKPGKTEDVVNPSFENVTIESAAVSDQPCNDYNDAADTAYPMIGSYTVQEYANGNFYISSDGKVKQLNNKNGKAQLPGTRAYITGIDADGKPAAVSFMAKSSYDNDATTGMDDETTDIDIISVSENDKASTENANNNVYNLSGQQVRSNVQSLDGLSKGVYVFGGNKIIKK